MKSLTSEIIESVKDEKLAELVAVHCMGWQKSNTKPYEEGCTAFQFWMNGDETLFLDHHWQPHLPTEKGKAQAIDLAYQYGIRLSIPTIGNCTARVIDKFSTATYEKSWQIAMLKACLYAEMGDR